MSVVRFAGFVKKEKKVCPKNHINLERKTRLGSAEKYICKVIVPGRIQPFESSVQSPLKVSLFVLMNCSVSFTGYEYSTV